MSSPGVERPDLPELMTWEELEQLPEEIAGQIELWNGRVVWRQRGPAEHQAFTFALTSALKRCARDGMAEQPQSWWRVDFETNVFLGDIGKSDFVTPDVVVYRRLDAPYQDIHAQDVLLVGRIHSPSSNEIDPFDEQRRYADAGIPWYWEVTLARRTNTIAMVRAHALETSPGKLPHDVQPLHPANYLLIGEWSPNNSDAITIDFPFPIHIPWSDLEF
ncbi:Uma2 family endonuclease [Nocardia abscessus]|uniref:Uma2 family endonuclease n=1 Tax=Nocardia abscessus TaxID=120957 RepID=UPI001E50283D|nr:Uma2 family endonuclease [Nocardia abscessus]